MKNIFLTLAFIFVGATGYAKGRALTLSEGKIFAPLKGSPATAGYGIFVNNSNKDVTLSIQAAPPFKAVELHETSEKEGKMAMQKVDTLVVPAHGTLELKPGGHHIMLFEPNREVKNDEKVKVSFKQDGKTQEYSFKVVPRVENNSEHHHHH